MNFLIIGGTRFAGKQFVVQALEAGHSVTVVSRGKTPLPFAGQVRHIACERRRLVEHLSATDHWDAVVDQVCFDATDARLAMEALNGRCDRYVVTSSQSVYEMHAPCLEEDFDPRTHTWDVEADKYTDYAEAKRQVEQVVATLAVMPWATVRFPFIVGPDDYSGRYDWHVDRIRNGQEIYVPNLDARISLVHQDDAGRGLLRLAEGERTGPVNLFTRTLSLRQLIEETARLAGRDPILAAEATDDNHSPYAPPEDWYLA